MATIFTRIINGDIPGHFVWRDNMCVAFLSINPLQTGHVLVVPIAEVDHWLDLKPETNSHLMVVGQRVGIAQQEHFSPQRVGLIVAGFEIPHAHLHVVPMFGIHDLDFDNAASSVDHDELASSATALRERLRDGGYGESVPAN